MIKKLAVLAVLAALASSIAAGPAAAADPWPIRPVKVVVPSTPGGVADIMARLVAQHLSESLGQNFTVENRAGAGGLIGSDYVAHAPADGYTFVISAMATHVLAPVMSASVTFDPLKDFTHVAYLGGPPNVVIVSNPLPARTLQALLDVSKSRSDGLSYGSPGVGTIGHLTGELLNLAANARLVHVPYRGGPLALADVMGNQIQMAVVGLTTTNDQIRSGAVRGIALTARNRLPDYPDLPTFVELGFPELVVTNWLALSGPANLPDDIVRKLNAEIVRIVRLPPVRERLLRDAIDPEALDPTAVTAFVKAEIARWTPVVRASGAKID